jgi:hypothetical protein
VAPDALERESVISPSFSLNRPISQLQDAEVPGASGEERDAIERKTTLPAREIGDDLQDVQLYLDRRFPGQAPVHIRLQRHYGLGARELNYLVVLIDRQEGRRRVRAGEAALRHIG